MRNMNLGNRKNIIVNMLQKNPGMGKTAVMKAMFMLQQVKGISLGCDFAIYTYGPYAAEIMEDIDELLSEGVLSSEIYQSHNYIGYKLKTTDKGSKAAVGLKNKETQAMENILDFVRGKTAKELELYATVIYIDNLYLKNGWSGNGGAESVVKKVHEIKPHFTGDQIKDAYSQLKELKYLQ